MGSFSFAERLFFIPTGNKLRNDKIHLESWQQKGSFRDRVSFIGLGISDSFEFEIRDERGRSANTRTSFDFAYNYLVPFADIAPGITFGVQDVLDKTSERRSFYGAITWKFNQFEPVNANSPVEVTLGVGTARYRGLFLGTRLPFTDQFRFIAEHDSRKLSAGFEVVPFKDAKLIWMTDEKNYSLGASYSIKF